MNIPVGSTPQIRNAGDLIPGWWLHWGCLLGTLHRTVTSFLNFPWCPFLQGRILINHESLWLSSASLSTHSSTVEFSSTVRLSSQRPGATAQEAFDVEHWLNSPWVEAADNLGPSLGTPAAFGFQGYRIRSKVSAPNWRNLEPPRPQTLPKTHTWIKLAKYVSAHLRLPAKLMNWDRAVLTFKLYLGDSAWWFSWGSQTDFLTPVCPAHPASSESLLCCSLLSAQHRPLSTCWTNPPEPVMLFS